jgi:hypothetical protein
MMYCKQYFLINFLNWRIQKLKHLGQEDTMDWAKEIPRMYELVKQLERDLFEDVDPVILECCLGTDKATVHP